MHLNKEVAMGYYSNKGHFFLDDFEESLEHRAKYGTANSTTSEKGTDGKKNNSSEYNHKYYEEHKDKWKNRKKKGKKKDDGNTRSDNDSLYYNADGTARFGHKDYDPNDPDFQRTDGRKLEGSDLTVFTNANGSTIILGKGIKFSFPPGTKITSAMEKKLVAIENGVKDKDKNKESYVAKMLNAVTSFADRQGLNTDTAGKKSDDKKEKSDKKKKSSGKEKEKSNSSTSTTKKAKEDTQWSKTVSKYSGKSSVKPQGSSDYNKKATTLTKAEATKVSDAAQERGKKMTAKVNKSSSYKNSAAYKAAESVKKKKKTTKQNAQYTKHYFGDDGAIISYYDGRY